MKLSVTNLDRIKAKVKWEHVKTNLGQALNAEIAIIDTLCLAATLYTEFHMTRMPKLNLMEQNSMLLGEEWNHLVGCKYIFTIKNLRKGDVQIPTKMFAGLYAKLKS